MNSKTGTEDEKREKRFTWRAHTAGRKCYSFSGKDVAYCDDDCAAYCLRAVPCVKSVFSEMTGEYEEVSYGHPVVVPYCIVLESALADMEVEQEEQG